MLLVILLSWLTIALSKYFGKENLDTCKEFSLAEVEVFSVFNGERLLIFTDRTESSGIVDNIVLPALPTELSENYETAEKSGVEYFVTVKHKSFEDVIDIPIKIYNKIESILPVNLVPVLR